LDELPVGSDDRALIGLTDESTNGILDGLTDGSDNVALDGLTE
jgi:hypothetical protein